MDRRSCLPTACLRQDRRLQDLNSFLSICPIFSKQQPRLLPCSQIASLGCLSPSAQPPRSQCQPLIAGSTCPFARKGSQGYKDHELQRGKDMNRLRAGQMMEDFLADSWLVHASPLSSCVMRAHYIPAQLMLPIAALWMRSSIARRTHTPALWKTETPEPQACATRLCMQPRAILSLSRSPHYSHHEASFGILFGSFHLFGKS